MSPLQAALASLAAATIALAVATLFNVVDFDFDRKPPSGLQDVPPREFLYLDGVRAEAYLSQLKEGNEKLRTISESVSSEVGAEIGIETAKLTGKAARQEAVQRTVTPTATSNFQALVKTLQENELLNDIQRDPAADAADDEDDASARAARAGADQTNFAQAWDKVREGDVVSFVARVRQPGYVAAYLALRRAPTHAPLRRRAEAALAAIGIPRLPLVAKIRTLQSSTGGAVLRLVLATQPEWFAAEPRLFSPRLRVVAKVVRRVDGKEFVDAELYRRFRPLLRPGLAVVRERLGTSEQLLRAELERHDSLEAPAAILVPIAIYSDGRPIVKD
jgi:hypothetical protein